MCSIHVLASQEETMKSVDNDEADAKGRHIRPIGLI